MQYKDMKEAMTKNKGSHPNEHVSCHRYGRMAICEGHNIEPFIVDSDIADEIEHRSWCSSYGYPATRIGGELVRLHDYVMSHDFDNKPDNVYVDHINQDKLDNRRQNLRFVTPSKSSQNMPIKRNNKTGVMGVNEVNRGDYHAYRAYIVKDRKQINLGHYQDINDAIAARREAETRLGFDTRPGTIKEKCDLLMKKN